MTYEENLMDIYSPKSNTEMNFFCFFILLKEKLYNYVAMSVHMSLTKSLSNLLTTEAKIRGLFGLLSSLSFREEICSAFQIHQPEKKSRFEKYRIHILIILQRRTAS